MTTWNPIPTRQFIQFLIDGCRFLMELIDCFLIAWPALTFYGVARCWTLVVLCSHKLFISVDSVRAKIKLVLLASVPSISSQCQIDTKSVRICAFAKYVFPLSSGSRPTTFVVGLVWDLEHSCLVHVLGERITWMLCILVFSNNWQNVWLKYIYF